MPSAGQMVFQFDEPTRFGDVWTLAIPAARDAAAAAPVRVTGVFDTLDRTFALPRQEKVSWKSADGTTIEGLLFYPADYVAGRRYPLVVQMHGGPADSDKFGAGAGPAAQLLSGARPATATPSSGRTTAAAPATATRSSATSWAAISVKIPPPVSNPRATPAPAPRRPRAIPGRPAAPPTTNPPQG